MPLNSAEIAAASGQFQSMYASNMQFSGMVGGMGGPPVQAERVTGGLMNAAASVGAPLASLGIGMLGLDPMSLGLKAGMGAYMGGAGLMGAGVAGLGVAAGVAVPMAVASYAANQMWTGAQQQQAFNQQMRGAFNFMTPYGQGFSTGQLGGINQQLFNMAGQQGPGGEMLGIRELQGLASNMGRMGMGGGVRDVSQFTQRFREMVDTLKVVAKEMGTSMQAAQEFVVAMRGSGIFNSGDQRRLATEIRQFSQAGNMATSELTAAANIGAQVSRAIGGRGAQGAFAGIRTAGMIGTAMQAGVLSEEDIYNATGLTGAEGRQALATRQLEQAGGFLRSGRGRMFLASVAGQNGQLDQASVEQWMSGDMNIGATRGRARGNLSSIGKAGFLRNEGRLRGAALQQFGGMLPTMALMQWASSKGIDIDQMDDRSMMFASRQLGMGMDELEDAVKMAKDMPRLREQQRSSARADEFQRRQATLSRTQGIEGVKRRFEEARDKVQNSLQRAGAQFYTDLSSMVETYINKLTGVAVEEYDQQIMDAYSDAIRGAGSSGLQKQLGGGARAGVGIASKYGTGTSPLAGRTSAQAGVNNFFGRREGVGRAAEIGLTGLFSSGASKLAFGDSDMDRMQAAGYGGLFRGVGGADDLQRRTNMAQGAYYATQAALRDPSLKDVHGNAKLDQLTQVLAQRANAGDKDAAAALMNIRSANTPEERQKIARQMMGEKGPPSTLSSLSGGFATMDEKNLAYGQAMAMPAAKRGRPEFAEGLLGMLGARKIDKQTEGMSVVDKVLTGLTGGYWKTVTDRRAAAAKGEYLNSQEGKSLISGIYSGDQASRDKIEDMLLKEDLPPEQREALKQMAAAADSFDLYEKAQKEKREPTEEEWAAIARRRGMSVDAVKSSPSQLSAVAKGQQEEKTRILAREMSRGAQQQARSLTLSGYATTDKSGKLVLSAGTEAAITSALGKDAGGIIKAMQGKLSSIDRQSMVGETTDSELLKELATEQGSYESQIRGLSVAQKRKLASELEKQGQFDQASELRSDAAERAKIEAKLKKGGSAYAIGSSLGVQFRGGDLRKFQELAKKDPSLAANQLLAKSGVNVGDLSEEARKDISSMLASGNAEAIQDLAAGRGAAGREVQAARQKAAKEKTEASQREQDPLLAKIEEHLARIAGTMGDPEVGTAIKSTARFTQQVANNTGNDSKDTEQGTQKAPQS